MKNIIAIALAIPVLSACVYGGQRFAEPLSIEHLAPPLKMYEGTIDSKRIATILTYQRGINPKLYHEQLWLARVVAVDGVPVKDLGWEVGKIQILPGTHTLTMTCQAYAYKTHQKEVSVSLSAGEINYPWTDIPLENGRPYSDGRCSPTLKNVSATTTQPAIAGPGNP